MRKQPASSILDEALKMYKRLPAYPREWKTVGKTSVRPVIIPAGENITLVGPRTMHYTGKSTLYTKMPIPFIYHQLLHEEHGVWMSTQLQELYQMWPVYRAAQGNVLVGGLGLGAIAHLLARKRSVTRVDVIEIDKDIIDLISPFLNQRIRIVNADIFEFIKKLKYHFYDFAFFDTWQSTGEWTWISQVVPLRRKVSKIIPTVMCWQEEVMHGQIRENLNRVVALDSINYRKDTTRHYYAIRRALDVIKYPSKPNLTADEIIKLQKMPPDQTVLYIANQLLRGIGSFSWEDMFGQYWDEVF